MSPSIIITVESKSLRWVGYVVMRTESACWEKFLRNVHLEDQEEEEEGRTLIWILGRQMSTGSGCSWLRMCRMAGFDITSVNFRIM